MVITVTQHRAPLKIVDQIILRGTVLDASRSSTICSRSVSASLITLFIIDGHGKPGRFFAARSASSPISVNVNEWY